MGVFSCIGTDFPFKLIKSTLIAFITCLPFTKVKVLSSYVVMFFNILFTLSVNSSIPGYESLGSFNVPILWVCDIFIEVPLTRIQCDAWSPTLIWSVA